MGLLYCVIIEFARVVSVVTITSTDAEEHVKVTRNCNENQLSLNFHASFSLTKLCIENAKCDMIVMTAS
jgi:hypothetical protein